MSRRYRSRAVARAAKELSLAPDPRDDENDDPDGEGSDPDGRIPIGPLDVQTSRERNPPQPAARESTCR
jgi:hypothetical protein